MSWLSHATHQKKTDTTEQYFTKKHWKSTRKKSTTSRTLNRDSHALYIWGIRVLRYFARIFRKPSTLAVHPTHACRCHVVWTSPPRLTHASYLHNIQCEVLAGALPNHRQWTDYGAPHSRGAGLESAYTVVLQALHLGGPWSAGLSHALPWGRVKSERQQRQRRRDYLLVASRARCVSGAGTRL